VHHDRAAVRAREFARTGPPGPAQAERHVHNQCLIITDLVVDDE
jgi:hypothetical protein